MKRALIAMTFVFGSTIPLAVASLFLFGCCVLPFHHAIHRVMPLCHIAAGILDGHHEEQAHHPSSPPLSKQNQTTPRLLSSVRVNEFPARAITFAPARHAAQSHIAYRSFITLGAARCDQDVGLTAALLETFRI